MNPDDFSFQIKNDVVVEKIHFSRATIKESTIFKNRLEKYLSLKYYKIIIDLSECSFIDSTFMGVMVVALKKVYDKGGEIKFVIKEESLLRAIKGIKLDRVFNLYKSVEEGIQSFDEMH